MPSKRLTIRLAPRRAVAVALAASILASPVGAFEVMSTTGNPGSYKITDSLTRPGVICRFEDHGGPIDDELDRIQVRKVIARGPKGAKTWVGYRYSVLQRLSPSKDYEFVFKSKIRKQRASKTMPTVFGWQAWTAPEDLLASDFRVLIKLIYYKKGSKKKARGNVRGVIEVHRHAHPDAPSFLVGKHGDGGECFYNFWT